MVIINAYGDYKTYVSSKEIAKLPLNDARYDRQTKQVAPEGDFELIKKNFEYQYKKPNLLSRLKKHVLKDIFYADFAFSSGSAIP